MPRCQSVCGYAAKQVHLGLQRPALLLQLHNDHPSDMSATRAPGADWTQWCLEEVTAAGGTLAQLLQQCETPRSEVKTKHDFWSHFNFKKTF